MQIPCFLTDTLANETTYEPNTGLMLVLHAALMRNLGVVFTEMAWLDDLAADCAEDRQYDGLFSASPVQVSRGHWRRAQSRSSSMTLLSKGRPS